MDSTSLFQFIVFIFLLFLSAFFSSAETALTTVKHLSIRTLIDEGNKSAIIVGKIINNPGKMLSAILIGNNIVNISASALSTILAQNLFGNYAVSFATGIVTILVLIFGEITPKTIASLHAESISLKYAYLIYGIIWILTPIIFFINKLSYGILKIFGIDRNVRLHTITETELRSIVDFSHEEGVIEKEERQMIKNLFDFSDDTAKDVMVPRINMTSINVDCTYEELISVFRRDRYTRIPVYEGSSDNVIGIINMKDLLLYDTSVSFNIKDYLRDAYYTHEYKNLFELMIEMKKTAINCIIVLDEYGATAGLITLEDLLEEIVGEIRDEYDYDEVDPITKISEYEYIVEGHMKIVDINELLEINLETIDYDTIGGYIMGKLDRLPEAGDSVEEKEITLTVDSVEKNRINKVHLNIKNSSPLN